MGTYALGSDGGQIPAVPLVSCDVGFMFLHGSVPQFSYLYNGDNTGLLVVGKVVVEIK